MVISGFYFKMVYVIQNNRVILARPHKVMVRYERIRLIHGGDAGVKLSTVSQTNGRPF
jgi:hypothetical protein